MPAKNNPLLFAHPQLELDNLIARGRQFITTQKIKRTVIGVSGGVDSSLVLYLALQIFGPNQVFPFILPYNQQSTVAASEVCQHLQVKPQIINIAPIVNAAIKLFPESELTPLQKGNFMARARMMVLFDRASFYQSLVLGTENLSEKNLGYFTMHGDSASSLELINHLYKTQVIQLAEVVLPSHLAHRTPSAELWPNQTDEDELGFSYEQADRIMAALWPQSLADEELQVKLLADIPMSTIKEVLTRCQNQQFKQELPYSL